MGQLISGPVTFKDTKFCQNSRYAVAASSMQGWRVRMEDSFTCFLNLPGDPSTAYFAVFDGHGGTQVPEYAASNLHTKITNQTEYGKGDIHSALRRGILSLDAEMQLKFIGQPIAAATPVDNSAEHSKSSVGEVGGSTCLVLLLVDRRDIPVSDSCRGLVYCANCGDSRAVMSRCGLAEPLSSDHKPTLPRERARILSAGGWIAGNNRVNGNLALSRALGDFAFKRNPQLSPVDQIVSPEPEIGCREISDEEDEFIVMGCDGIWDVLTSQEVVSFVRCRLAAGSPPDSVCEELMMHCLAPTCNSNGLGCDNMTVVLICFLNGGTYADLQARCSRPCPAGMAADIIAIRSPL